MRSLLIKNAKALVGIRPAGLRVVRGRAMAELPRIDDAWLLAENGRITSFGPMGTLPGIAERNGLEVIDATGRYVLPGWCDPHTHTVHAAPREEEFVDKINGLTYQEIAARGGGILNSAAKLRAMSEDELFEKAKYRLEVMMAQGTVAVEIKSGYGLTVESELKMLRVAKRLKSALPLQVKTTLLAAHALPVEFKEDRSGYMDLILNELLPQVKAEGLADFIDVFCETNYFTVAEMERILEAGTRLGRLPMSGVCLIAEPGKARKALGSNPTKAGAEFTRVPTRNCPSAGLKPKSWLPDMDLNHDKQIQSLLCYRYTIGQSVQRQRLGILG